MFKYSEKSLMNLAECHPDLRRLFLKVIEGMDCTILCGYRNETEQNRAYDNGFSKLKFPDSMHNKYPSMAVDVVPYPVDWKNINRIILFGHYVKGVAKGLDIDIEWGGDWKKFPDYPHYQIS